MGKVLDKRTADSRVYDIDCTDLLATGETISSVTSVTADQGTLTFGSPSINAAPIAYADGRTAAIGKVIQVQISAGTIPTGQSNLQCTVRALFATNVSPAVEATVVLRLIDTPNMY
ncbi:hypothetical protein [Variovorax ginsengisoli]|uniref:Uncharacterized protein n=1 Tax=Variovorax ginsengisoli TaxID=363844 RepID=A0ABT8SDP0_9BURK|nr:hypothetical protein [Variovorax ginsengisoli]MDN8617858.1 hypothetical protein [Variovorax ginsengisoli]MDO1537028.1 hypothetical protein [Variovorax ginsengisoli]